MGKTPTSILRRAFLHPCDVSRSTPRRTGLLLVLGISLTLLPPSLADATNWTPTVLVRTESFSVIDDGTASSDIELRFGEALNERFFWDRTNSRFRLTDDLSVQGYLSGSSLRIDGLAEVHGALTASGAVRFDSDLTLNDDQTSGANTVLTFGSNGGNETLTWADTADRFEFSDDLVATGALSASGALSIDGAAFLQSTLSGASTITFSALKGCDTIDTSANGVLSCGTDAGGGGGGISFSAAETIYVNQRGDTMTGTLTIRSTSGTTALGLRVAGTMSGRSLHTTNGISASGAVSFDSTAAFNNVNYTWPGSGAASSGNVLKVNPANGQLSWSADGGAVDVQTFTATGTWTKPGGVTVTRIQIWGGGGSGGRGGSADAGGGGGGGSYLDVLVLSSTLAATETCGVGAGGSAVTADEANGELGGKTTFDVYAAYGGGPGFGATSANGGGGGGACPFAAGAIGTATAGGAGGCGAAAGVDDYLGGGGGTVNGGDSGIGGGGGGLGIASGTEGAGGNSVYGGGGGGGADGAATPSAAGGTSIYGGNGGIGSTASTAATAGSQPGGGGGGSEQGTTGAGGDGKCIITSW